MAQQKTVTYIVSNAILRYKNNGRSFLGKMTATARESSIAIIKLRLSGIIPAAISIGISSDPYGIYMGPIWEDETYMGSMWAWYYVMDIVAR